MRDSAAVIMVSNNVYRIGRAIGSGTRPRIDAGVLGIAARDAPGVAAGADGHRGPWRRWAVPSFEVGSAAPVPAGVDGEALVLEPPLRFAVRPGALRVRIAPGQPGASPSAGFPEGLWDGIRRTLKIAVGRDRPGR